MRAVLFAVACIGCASAPAIVEEPTCWVLESGKPTSRPPLFWWVPRQDGTVAQVRLRCCSFRGNYLADIFHFDLQGGSPSGAWGPTDEGWSGPPSLYLSIELDGDRHVERLHRGVLVYERTFRRAGAAECARDGARNRAQCWYGNALIDLPGWRFRRPNGGPLTCAPRPKLRRSPLFSRVE